MARRLLVVLLAGAMVLAGCTDADEVQPQATPTASTAAPPVDLTGSQLRVAVVLATSDTAAASVALSNQAQLAGLAADAVDELVVTVGSDRAAQEDLVRFFAADGVDLVCVVGPGATGLLRRIAGDHPGTRFCAVPAIDDAPATAVGSLLVVQPDASAARDALARAAAIVAGPSETVGVLAVDARISTQLTAPLVAARAASGVTAREARTTVSGTVIPAVIPTATTAIGADDPAAALRAMTTAGVRIIVIDGSPAAQQAARRARAPTGLLGPAESLVDGDGTLLERVVAAHTFDVAMAVDVAIQRLHAGWEPGIVTLGFPDGALGLVAGPVDAAEDIVVRVLAELRSAG